MKALVTGAAGFIASHLASALLDRGAAVVAIDSFTDYYARALKERNLEENARRDGFRFVETAIQSADLPQLLDGVTHVFHLAAQAGVRHVFIGLENINPDNLIAAKKRQNKITEYREMIQKWREHGAITYAGYILGFPSDTKESILRDVEIIKRELPLDILEFFFLTPLPGSEDHKVLLQNGIWMDPDMNKYDVEHVVTAHPKMSAAEWKEAYRTAWGHYYTDDHLETIVRRAYASGINIRSLMPVLFWFSSAVPVENLHPLQWGIFRIKYRHDRRSGLPLESPLRFYGRYAAEIARKVVLVARRDPRVCDRGDHRGAHQHDVGPGSGRDLPDGALREVGAALVQDDARALGERVHLDVPQRPAGGTSPPTGPTWGGRSATLPVTSATSSATSSTTSF